MTKTNRRPRTPDKGIRAAIEKVNHRLQSDEGVRQLKQLLDDAKSTNEKLRREAQIDPKSLREPMTL